MSFINYQGRAQLSCALCTVCLTDRVSHHSGWVSVSEWNAHEQQSCGEDSCHHDSEGRREHNHTITQRPSKKRSTWEHNCKISRHDRQRERREESDSTRGGIGRRSWLQGHQIRTNTQTNKAQAQQEFKPALIHYSITTWGTKYWITKGCHIGREYK